jgi:hypothetical protein
MGVTEVVEDDASLVEERHAGKEFIHIEEFA